MPHHRTAVRDTGLVPRAYMAECAAMLRLTWPLLLGNTMEWYEYGVFGYVSHEMELNFFGGSLIRTWLAFALSFAVRPIGGIVLGRVADKHGRRFSVTISLVGMLIATVGQGLLPARHFLPEFQMVGVGLLLALRALQGLSVGGEYPSISAYLLEAGRPQTLGMLISMMALSVYIAWGVASALCAVLTALLTPEQMLVWGWRVPFLLALPPGLISLCGRMQLPETEAFVHEQRAAASEEKTGEARSPVLELIVEHPYALLVGFGASIGIASMWWCGGIWAASMVRPHLGAETSLWVGNLSQIVAGLSTPVAGWLTDVKGVGWVTFVGSLFIMATGLPAFLLLSYFPESRAAAYVGVGLIYGIAQGLGGATISLFTAELFPVRLRSLGGALTFNMAASYFGGFGPVVCQALVRVSPRFGPGIYLSACGAASAAAVGAGLLLARHRGLRLAHRRESPYFGGRAPWSCTDSDVAAAGKDPEAGAHSEAGDVDAQQ